MKITKTILIKAGVRSDRADQYVDDLNEMMGKHEINTPIRMAHFLSQVLHESGRLKYTKESMNYSAKRLRVVFRKYFSVVRASEYARNRKRIGSRVYANRMGNGNEASGDGYRYRGRGLIQLTGKNNYRKFGKWLGIDILSSPELVATEYAVASAVFYWDTNNLNRYADKNNHSGLTKAINGGYNGLKDRRMLFNKVYRAIKAAR